MRHTIQSEADITNLLMQDTWRMDVLRAADELQLPNWWIGAGFLRNAIWDALLGNEPVVERDVDLVYFDADRTEPQLDWTYDEQMKEKFPFADWEIRNQARMHYVNDFPMFNSTEDGIAHWVETATCVAVKLEQNRFKYLFCHGTEDLFGLVARPVSYFRSPELIQTFRDRIKKKQWTKRWPELTVTEH